MFIQVALSDPGLAALPQRVRPRHMVALSEDCPTNAARIGALGAQTSDEDPSCPLRSHVRRGFARDDIAIRERPEAASRLTYPPLQIKWHATAAQP